MGACYSQRVNAEEVIRVKKEKRGKEKKSIFELGVAHVDGRSRLHEFSFSFRGTLDRSPSSKYLISLTGAGLRQTSLSRRSIFYTNLVEPATYVRARAAP